jgi:[NiFe] hydrogenase assembly HybE family chaperone
VSVAEPSVLCSSPHAVCASTHGLAAALSAEDVAWVQALEAVYGEIAHTRMAGLPVMNPVLQVQAVGFGGAPGQPSEEGPDGIWGVLITPWFMNLVWRAGEVSDVRTPAEAGQTNGALALAVGHSRQRQLGGQLLAFIGARDERLGAFECCSLISPMFQFADQAAAVAVAHAVLTELCQAPAGLAAQPQAASADEVVATRRRFLFGRSDATRA